MGVDTDYYGFRDDEDGLLLKLEAQAEAKVREEAIADWNRKAIERYGSLANAPVPERTADAEFKSHVYVPTEDDIEKMLLEKRKEELLARYVG